MKAKAVNIAVCDEIFSRHIKQERFPAFAPGEGQLLTEGEANNLFTKFLE